MLAEYNRGQNFKWLNYIKQILISVGEPGLLNWNFIQNPKATTEKIVKRLITYTYKNRLQNYNHPQKEETAALRFHF